MRMLYTSILAMILAWPRVTHSRIVSLRAVVTGRSFWNLKWYDQ